MNDAFFPGWFKRFSSTLLCCLLAACGSNEVEQKIETPQVSVIRVAKQDLSIPIEFVGQTKGAVDADVSARVEGVIQSIHFKEGSEVKEGDLLYTIDPAPFESNVSQAKAKLSDAEAKLAKADADLSRVKPLASMKAISQRDLDAAVAQQGSAKAAVEAAKAAYDAANIELGYTKITASVSGIIGLTKAKVGELVGRSPHAVLLTTVSQLNPIHVRFTISEKEYLYFSRLKKKEEQNGEKPDPAILTLVLSDNSIHEHRGKIASIDSQIDPTTGTITLEAAFPNPDKILRPGQFAKIQTIGETLKDVVTVPKRAIRDIQGIKQIAVVSPDNVVEVRTIKTGREVGEAVQVLEGLTAGEQIVPEIQLRLKSGTKVVAKLQ